ncbi:MAG: ABC transporter ATP-binding protein/permease [Spirochaetaceae bacterium]|nr:ABC transporter ATP-binding protein/permease [Spirochaetaceae bacterium]
MPSKKDSPASRAKKPVTSLTVIFSYLKPYWKWATLAVLLMAVEVFCDLAQPTLMSTIVDKGVSTGNIGVVLRTGIIMVLVSLLGMVGGIGCSYFASKASLASSTNLRSDLFKKVQSFSFNELDDFTPGSLVTRLTNDVVQVQNLTLSMMRILVRAPLLFIGGIVMAVTINPGLSTILVVVLPILIVALTFVMMKGFPLFRKVQTTLDRVNGIMRENLAGMRLIKAFVRSDYEEKRFGKANEDLAELTVTGTRIVGLVMPIIFLIMNLAVVAAVWFSGKQVNLGTMQVGKVIAFTTYLSQILFGLMMVSFVLMNASRATASARRIAEVLNKEGETDLGQNPSTASAETATTMPSNTPAIEFDHVSFHYPRAANEPVLSDISFKATKGSLVGILGATGSGKSTMINLIPRFYETDSGRILIDGEDTSLMQRVDLRACLGLVPQDSVLFTGSIAENLRWGNQNATDKELVDAAYSACALDFIQAFPKGFDTIIGQRGVGLSGGQRQRICIARAILRKPEILILDDATSAVDMATEAYIQERLRKKTGMTVIVIAQRVSSVLDANQILVLEHGHIVGEGTHEELLRSNGIYQDIYRSQVTEGATNV